MKLLLVDDHPLFCDGLNLLLLHTWPDAVTRTTHSLAEALARLEAEPDVDLILLDLQLPDAHGLDGLTAIREAAPHCKIVVLSADERIGTILASIDGGAAGFIPKTAQPGVMEGAIRIVRSGGVYLPSSALTPPGAPSDPDAIRLPGGDLIETTLSGRQLDVLRLLIDGKPNKLICRELSLSESTVKTHLAAIFRKLGVNSRTQAVLQAARLGLHQWTPGSGD